jgi:type IV pilus assembly protein PilB
VSLVRLLKTTDLIGEGTPPEVLAEIERAPNELNAVLKYVDEGVLADLLSDQLGIPRVEVSGPAASAEAIQAMPRDLAKRHDAMPIRLEGSQIVVAFANPLDHDAIKAIGFATKRKIKVTVAPASQVRDALRFAFDFGKEVGQKLAESQSTGSVEILETKKSEDMASLLSDPNDASAAIRVVQLILVEGLRAGASDIHLEPTAEAVRVRYRVDGVMEEGVVVPKTLQAQLVGRVKVLASLDISERRKPQDGSIRLRFEDRRVDVRVSVLPTPVGEKVVLRVLDTESKSPTLAGLGFSEESTVVLRREIRRPEGLILITGPTGSGKTTTAHALLSEIAASGLNLVTIENPVEYRLAGVTQVEINEKAGVTFPGTLRSVLRQDPDVIFVGEIRDFETAEIALRAAQTGHLVLSTVHTIDAVSSITRLLDLGVDSWAIAGSLRLILAQRLVRQLCPNCRTSAPPSEHDLAHLGPRAAEVRGSSVAAGCLRCRRRGFVGRRGLFEVMPVSPSLRSLIEQRAAETEMRAQARRDGVLSLQDHAIAAVNTGETTLEEIIRVVPPEARSEAPKSAPVAAPGPSTGASAPSREDPARPAPAPRVARGASRPADAAAPERVAITGIDFDDTPDPEEYTVLVVDDERVNLKLIAHCLRKAALPLRVLSAENGEAALEIAEREHVHMALLDMMMPGMTGVELCARLRADPRTKEIPIFMLTAVSEFDVKESAFEAGADDYITKPVDAKELLIRATRALNRAYGIAGISPPS